MFDGQGIGNAVYGLQRLVDCPESRELVDVLAMKVQTSSHSNSKLVRVFQLELSIVLKLSSFLVY